MAFVSRNKLVSAICVVALLLGAYSSLVAAPRDFPIGLTLTIKRGTPTSGIVQALADAHVISNSFVLATILRLSGTSSRVQAGTYLFDQYQNVLLIARRLSAGDYHLPPVSITFPEGVTVRDISEKIASAVSPVLGNDVATLGKSQEGYLFPDTYQVSADATAESVLKTMRANFDAKTQSLASEVLASGHTLGDIITLASLVEKEARTDENRRIVAGILWNRVARSMPLQVDAVFGYIFNRDTYAPSLTDLNFDSPYNTYRNVGLPPGPICNPGLASIEAALHPAKTKYLFYLTDANGVMHYATTFAEHQSNKAKYLR